MELNGLYRGEVINNDDPLKRGRLLVNIPSLNASGGNAPWAESCLPPNYFSIPAVGEYVWIMFETGDFEHPVWMGIFPTREYVRDKLMKDKSDRIHYDPYITTITDGMNSISLHGNDLKGEIKLTFSDSLGSSVTLDSNNASLTLRGANSLNGSPTIDGGIKHNAGSASGIPKVPKKIQPMGVERY